uniref:Putative membrane protein n=1 Tax=Talaromyces marneffei PM1 TaxID=1077442 RepID=A0A093VKN4_TALMA
MSVALTISEEFVSNMADIPDRTVNNLTLCRDTICDWHPKDQRRNRYVERGMASSRCSSEKDRVVVYDRESESVEAMDKHLFHFEASKSEMWDTGRAVLAVLCWIDSAEKWLFNTYTTLFTTLDVLTFTPYEHPTEFCQNVTQGTCPLGPVFNVNGSDPSQLRAFTVQHELGTSFQLASLVATLRIKSGDPAGTDLGCVSGIITPDLGATLKGTFTFLPLLVLVLLTLANIIASTYSPWGSTNIFRWTSNYGRDEDLLRLVTPGFADCLQYIQFIVLTGALSLSYPGYYQPVVSSGAWSILMFNHSFASPGGGIDPVVDGIYVVNGTHGLDRLRQYIGLESIRDVWPGSIIWLLVILSAVTVLTQIAFGFQWIYHRMARVLEEDLRSKNVPFTIGNTIRITFNFFLLPTVSLALYQLVIAGHSTAYVVALAVILIVALLLFALWMIRLIISARPRAYLFDDLSTVLLYGPLYNTYRDDVAPFALVPIFITFLRAIAIGALQPSGVAQVVLLAICEVAMILLLVAFRPYASPTSMNLYQLVFSFVRFLVVLLSVAFVPSLGISEQTKGWIGYAILVLHGGMLVFGFFLNALQTLIEVIARLAGAGGAEGGATRGGLTKVFGVRQLSRRNPRSSTRQSMASEAAMLVNMDERSSAQFGGSRARSISGSSAMLLNRQAISDGRISIAYDAGSAHGGPHSRTNSGMYTPTTPGAASSAFSHPAGYLPMGTPKSGSVIGFKSEATDPYYRPPRPRTTTVDTQQSGGDSRAQGASGSDTEDVALESAGQPLPAHLGTARDDVDLDDGRPNRKDYAVREVDFYYRVRGPALSHTGTRKLKTGPADPTGPVSSASGWFRRLLGGKTKEQGKGFEVIRSSRAPPTGMFPPAEDQEYHEPYRDEPESQSPDETGEVGHTRNASGVTTTSYHDSDGTEEEKGEQMESFRLPPIDVSGSIELPSRAGSRNSTLSNRPSLPRKSSKRHGPQDSVDEGTPALLPIPGSPDSAAHSHGRIPSSDLLQPSGESGARLPFAPSEAGSKTSQERHGSTASTSSTIQRVPSAEPGRPSGMGYVAHHRAGASIHQLDSEHPLTGSTAELVEQTTDSESSHSQRTTT